MEKISRLMDGDVPQNEMTATLRGCGAEGRQAWQTYHLIGEAMRGDLDESVCVASADSALYSRICSAIADEPNVFVPAVASANKAARERNPASVSSENSQSSSVPADAGRWLNVGNGASVWRPWALAASVATAAVVGWQTLVTQPRELAAAKAQSSVASQANSAVTTVVVPSASMSRYLNAHTEAAPVTRLSGPRVYIQNVSTVTH